MHGTDHEECLLALREEGWISESLYEVKSGKEATVHCCRAGMRSLETGLIPPESPLVAVKVHRPLETRRFRNDSMYLAGRVHMARDSRIKRAAINKSSFGREVQYGTWLYQEFEVMRRLAHAGLPIPVPLVANDRGLIMQYIGDENAAAPNLLNADLQSDDVEQALDDIFDLIAAMLDLHCVHGDLSPYNILWSNGAPILIDFPQAIDPRLHPGALQILTRDVRTLTRWAAKLGIDRDPDQFTHSIWKSFLEGTLG